METSDLYNRFGQLLRAHRLRLKMTQADVGKAVGLSRASIANIETGRQHVPLHHVYSFSYVFKVDVSALLPTVETVNNRELLEKINSTASLTEDEKKDVAMAVAEAIRSDNKSKMDRK